MASCSAVRSLYSSFDSCLVNIEVRTPLVGGRGAAYSSRKGADSIAGGGVMQRGGGGGGRMGAE